jgi:acyl-CoA reductase-like NAD-dependent aldehyde dehydrogenase
MAMTELFIDGSFVRGDGSPFPVFDPSTGEAFAEAPGASLEQYGEAVSAARRAFDQGPWPILSVEERAEMMLMFSDALQKRRDALVDTIVAEAGCPRATTERTQIGLAFSCAQDYPGLARSLPVFEPNEVPLGQLLAGNKLRTSVRRFEPVGVVVAITPYNYPLVCAIRKVVPALLTGCCVVLRPSPQTPLSALIIGEVADEVGLPAGVLNVVLEGGVEGAELITTTPAVDCVSFTGSVAVGRAIAAQAAVTLKRLVLELGGKSVQIHLPDVFESGIGAVVANGAAIFTSHAGQACSAQTRMLVPHNKKAEVLEGLRAAAEGLSIGSAHDPATMVGPVISQAQLERIEALVGEGLAAGGRLVTGGGRPKDLDRGWYYEPTVVDIDDNSNPLAQREVFGPVLTVQGYGAEDEAVRIANESEYGLSGAVYTADLPLGLSVAERIRSGTIAVNGGMSNAFVSVGGYKQSGLGHEQGVLGIRAFQECKHIVITSR